MALPSPRPWAGVAFRHLPVDSPYRPLDFRFAGLSATNRWNDAGVPAVYLAGDRSVAMAEWARHLDARGATARSAARDRVLWQIDVRVGRALDLREPDVREAIGIATIERFLDPSLCRATARYLRELELVDALIVPSLAFLDDIARWNIVVYLDRVADRSQALSRPRRVGRFAIAEADTAAAVARL